MSSGLLPVVHAEGRRQLTMQQYNKKPLARDGRFRVYLRRVV
jgi:hypothetical protein